ncbi:unnamed protein product [Sphacelaria rigidula]
MLRLTTTIITCDTAGLADRHSRVWSCVWSSQSASSEHFLKALKIALSADSGGGGADDDGVMPSYGISFNFWRKSRVGEPHPYSGSNSGMFLGPDGPHEGNHNKECRKSTLGSIVVGDCPRRT